MCISVRIETLLLDTSAQLSLAQLEAACVSEGRVPIQRHRALSSALATRGFFFVPRQETKILVPYSSWPEKGSPGRQKKRRKTFRSCPANRKMALASYRLLPHFRAVSCCSLCSQAEKRHLPPILLQRKRSILTPCHCYLFRPEQDYFSWGQQGSCLCIHQMHNSQNEVRGRVSSGVARAMPLPQARLCSGKGGTEVAPAESCINSQAGASWDRDRSYKPAQEQVHQDKKKLIGQWFLVFPFLFPVSSVVPHLAHALGSPGVSELFVTAGKPP